MTANQIKGLKADIMGMLMDAVNNIFFETQEGLDIKNGDVAPLDALCIEQKEEQLAEMIVDVLLTQLSTQK